MSDIKSPENTITPQYNYQNTAEAEAVEKKSVISVSHKHYTVVDGNDPETEKRTRRSPRLACHYHHADATSINSAPACSSRDIAEIEPLRGIIKDQSEGISALIFKIKSQNKEKNNQDKKIKIQIKEIKRLKQEKNFHSTIMQSQNQQIKHLNQELLFYKDKERIRKTEAVQQRNREQYFQKDSYENSEKNHEVSSSSQQVPDQKIPSQIVNNERTMASSNKVTEFNKASIAQFKKMKEEAKLLPSAKKTAEYQLNEVKAKCEELTKENSRLNASVKLSEAEKTDLTFLLAESENVIKRLKERLTLQSCDSEALVSQSKQGAEKAAVKDDCEPIAAVTGKRCQILLSPSTSASRNTDAETETFSGSECKKKWLPAMHDAAHKVIERIEKLEELVKSVADEVNELKLNEIDNELDQLKLQFANILYLTKSNNNTPKAESGSAKNLKKHPPSSENEDTDAGNKKLTTGGTNAQRGRVERKTQQTACVTGHMPAGADAGNTGRSDLTAGKTNGGHSGIKRKTEETPSESDNKLIKKIKYSYTHLNEK